MPARLLLPILESNRRVPVLALPRGDVLCDAGAECPVGPVRRGLHVLHGLLGWLGFDTHGDPTASLQVLLKSADAAFGLLLGLVIVAAAGLGQKGRSLLGRPA